MGFIHLLSKNEGSITYANRVEQQDLINLSVQVDLGNCSKVPAAITEPSNISDDVIWLNDHFYIPTGVTVFSFNSGGTDFIWQYNGGTSTWDSLSFTTYNYTPDPGPITYISDGVSHDGIKFIIPEGITEFTFVDNGVQKTATYDSEWIITNFFEVEDTFQDVEVGNGIAAASLSWESKMNDISVISEDGLQKIVAPSQTGRCYIHRNDAQFNSDHYVETRFVTTRNNSRKIGPAARVTTDACYAVVHDTNNVKLVRVSVTSETTLAQINSLALSAGDRLGLSVIGNELRVYINDVLQTSIGVSGVITDSTITDGKPGIYCNVAPISYLQTIDRFYSNNI